MSDRELRKLERAALKGGALDRKRLEEYQKRHGQQTRTDRIRKDYRSSEVIAAARNNDLAGLRELLDDGADPDASMRWDEGEGYCITFYETNALAEALDREHREVALLLARRGTERWIGGSRRWESCDDPVTLAAKLGYLDVLEALLQRSYASPDKALAFALEEGKEELVRRLLWGGAKLSGHELREAHEAGRIDALALIREDARGLGFEWLEICASFGCTEAIAAESTEVDFEDAGKALVAAARNNHLSTVELLLSKGVDPKGTWALAGASGKGYLEVVKRLLEAGAELDPDGDPPALQCAASAGQLEMVVFLLEAGANPTGFNPHTRRTPLFSAAMSGHAEVVDLLINSGANRADFPLSLSVAASYGHTAVVKTLLTHGADPDPAMKDYTQHPINRAVWNAYLDIIRLLLDAGVSPKKALSWARDEKQPKVVALIKTYMPDEDSAR